MELTALLFWPEDRGARLLERLLDDQSISTEWCSDPEDAAIRLLLRRFDCLLVDCAHPQGQSLITEAAHSEDHKSSIKVAFLEASQQLEACFRLGANLALYQPLVLDRARNALRVARSLMRHEKRRTRRVGVAENLMMEINGEKRQAFLADISESGMAMISTKSLARTERIRLLFALPHSNVIMNLTGEIVFRTAEGRYGIRFLDMPHQIRKALREWILSRIKLEKPAPTAPRTLALLPVPEFRATPAVAANIAGR